MTRKQIHVMTIGLLLANVMSGLDATIINTALPAIIADLHGISCMGLIVSVFLLGMSVSTLLWSKFGERMGNKKAFELAVVLFIAGSALEGLSPDILSVLGCSWESVPAVSGRFRTLFSGTFMKICIRARLSSGSFRQSTVRLRLRDRLSAD